MEQSFMILRCSVLSDSLQPHRLYPARLLGPLVSPGKSIGEGCHLFLQETSQRRG